jgi:hypothetical protein
LTRYTDLFKAGCQEQAEVRVTLTGHWLWRKRLDGMPARLGHTAAGLNTSLSVVHVIRFNSLNEWKKVRPSMSCEKGVLKSMQYNAIQCNAMQMKSVYNRHIADSFRYPD